MIKPAFYKRYACAILPRAGLANQLFPWARAVIWSKTKQVELLPTIWLTLRIGPLFRGERDLKFYSDIFVPMGFMQFLHRSLILAFCKKTTETDSFLFDDDGARLYVFQDLRDHFAKLRDFREIINSELLKIVRDEAKPQKISEKPFVGVHIRLGDFKRNGQTLPLNWYVDMINMIRGLGFQASQIVIFTDGEDHEIRDLSVLENVHVFRSNNAMTDLLALSQASFLILNGLSSYSAWAAFLSDAPTISRSDQPITNWGLAIDSQKHFVVDHRASMPEALYGALTKALA